MMRIIVPITSATKIRPGRLINGLPAPRSSGDVGTATRPRARCPRAPSRSGMLHGFQDWILPRPHVTTSGERMNRRDLVAELAERTDTDKRTADATFQAFIDVVTDTVATGEPVAISGFAKFARRDVPAKPRRKGRNPATGEEIWLAPKPASRSVKITPLKAFKDA